MAASVSEISQRDVRVVHDSVFDLISANGSIDCFKNIVDQICLIVDSDQKTTDPPPKDRVQDIEGKLNADSVLYASQVCDYGGRRASFGQTGLRCARCR